MSLMPPTSVQCVDRRCTSSARTTATAAATVAKALGREGITVDMSADYCRLAEWRTNDPKQLARAAEVRYYKPKETS